MAEPQSVRLRITDCVVKWSGKNKRGNESTIYEIKASRENGEPITDKALRSFEELPVGDGVLDLNVVRFESEQYGISYTLSRKEKVSRTAELQKQVETLEEKVTRIDAWIRGQVQAAGGGSPPQQAAPPPAAAPAADPVPPVAAQAALDERYGAEAPF